VVRAGGEGGGAGGEGGACAVFDWAGWKPAPLITGFQPVTRAAGLRPAFPPFVLELRRVLRYSTPQFKRAPDSPPNRR